MPTETEAKIPADDLGPVEARLRGLNAQFHGDFTQDDRFFDSPDRRLLREDRGLRLRSAARHDQPDRPDQHLLTYKGARQAGPVKQRDQIELGVSDAEALVELLANLDLHLMLHVQKRRRRYRLADCMIELDTLPLLGRFVEIEGPSPEAIVQVARQLDLDMTRATTDSYAGMLMALAEQRGLETSPARFLLPGEAGPSGTG